VGRGRCSAGRGAVDGEIVEVGNKVSEGVWDRERWEEVMYGGIYSARKAVCGVDSAGDVAGVECASCCIQGGMYVLENIVGWFIAAAASAPTLKSVAGYLPNS